MKNILFRAYWRCLLCEDCSPLMEKGFQGYRSAAPRRYFFLNPLYARHRSQFRIHSASHESILLSIYVRVRSTHSPLGFYGFSVRSEYIWNKISLTPSSLVLSFLFLSCPRCCI